jgi:hypothetical protein
MQLAVPLVGAACALSTLAERAAASVVAATMERAAAPATTKARISGRRQRAIVRFLSVESGEGHGDSEAAAGSGVRGERGVVGAGDRLHDRETEPDSVAQGPWV